MATLLIGLVCVSLVIHGESSFVTRTGNGSHQGEEGRLIRHLLDNGYDVRERPFIQDGGPVLFNLTLYLLSISDLDPKTQVLSGNSWLTVNWFDSRLAWDPKDYAGVGSFTVNIDQTWSPKLYLQNTVMDKPVNPIQHDVSQTYVTYDGQVHLESPLLHHTSCDLNLQKFPFDQQECWLIFTTQNTPIHLVKTELNYVVVGNPNVSSEWNIVSSSTRSDYISIGESNVTYEIVKMGLKLNRLPKFYIQNVTAPIAFLSWLSIVIFLIPAKSGERLSSSISLVLGLTVFQIVITDNMPKNSRGETAIVISYVSNCFIVSIVVAILSAIVINISHREGCIQNKIIRGFFFDYLGPCFLVGGCGRKKALGSNLNESCKVGDLEIKDTPEKALSTKGHFISRPAWMTGHQTQVREERKDYEMLGLILDRIFMLVTLVTLATITLRFLLLCEESIQII